MSFQVDPEFICVTNQVYGYGRREDLPHLVLFAEEGSVDSAPLQWIISDEEMYEGFEVGKRYKFTVKEV